MGKEAHEISVFFIVAGKQARTGHHRGLRVHVFEATTATIGELQYNGVFTPRWNAKQCVMFFDDLFHIVLEGSQSFRMRLMATAVPKFQVVSATVDHVCDGGVGWTRTLSLGKARCANCVNSGCGARLDDAPSLTL